MPETLKKQQMDFCQYLRDPKNTSPPENISLRRLDVYQHLIYENIQSFLKQAFPVCYEVLSEKDWQSLLQQFIQEHRCQNPLFHKIPEEFLHFLQQQENLPKPFLVELAHYEWIELDLEVAIEENTNLTNSFSKNPRLSSLARVLEYHYPVHQITKDHQPNTETLTHLLVYRTKTYAIKFMILNPSTAYLLTLIMDGERVTEEALSLLANQMPQFDPAIILKEGREILESLSRQNIVLNF